MLRYLISRPVAVLLVFFSLILGGLLAMKRIPVSLLPDVDIPQIVIRADLRHVSAEQIEKMVVAPIRGQLADITELKEVRTIASNHMALVYLTFEYGARMDLLYVQVNEKIDRLAGSLPREMPRPVVIRSTTADVPVVRLQVTPRAGSGITEISRLCEKIVRRRLEQVKGVSVVDMNGSRSEVVEVVPDLAALQALGIDGREVTAILQQLNLPLGQFTIRNGHYAYFVSFPQEVSGVSELGMQPLRLKNGTVIRLSQIATVRTSVLDPVGYHLYNGKESVVITVHKQADSRMDALMPELYEAVGQFREDYPQAEFACTQDQGFLLRASIENLEQDIYYGAALTVLLLLLLMSNRMLALLMCISIPVSLAVTFLLFHLLGISFNIISLSGLALGIGMLIDNSIVVVDSIHRKTMDGKPTDDSAVEGTGEVVVPVISQVLTTVAVYLPLVLLNGMAGLLVYDQSIALTISLGISLGVAFVLVPVLYKLLVKGRRPGENADTPVYRWVSAHYHRMITHILNRRLLYFGCTFLLMPVGIWMAAQIPKQALPKMERKESLARIVWNEPVSAQENLRRIKSLLRQVDPHIHISEVDIGIRQFILQQDDNTEDNSLIYYASDHESERALADAVISDRIAQQYPMATCEIEAAPNAFTQLFRHNTPYFEARFRPLKTAVKWKDSLLAALNASGTGGSGGQGLVKEQGVEVVLDQKRMQLYGVSRETLTALMEAHFGSKAAGVMHLDGENRQVRYLREGTQLHEWLELPVKGRDATYPARQFVRFSFNNHFKHITGDRSAPFASVTFQPDGPSGHRQLEDQLAALAQSQGLHVSFGGSVYESQQQIGTLWQIFFLVLVLLYIILAIQYESLLQPLIVMLTIPLGITGGMTLLWITGTPLDSMALIGFVVILGLIVDDPILKVETLNHLWKQKLAEGREMNGEMLAQIIHEAGAICLKPLLLVSLTTSIVFVPVLIFGGIGNELQKPMALVIIGGLSIGTFFTTWFVPLAFWYFMQCKQKLKWKSSRKPG